MRYNFILILLALGVSSAMGQKKTGVAGDQSVIAYDQGKALYDKGKYSEAIPLFVNCLTADPANEDAMNYLGLSYRYNGQNDKAVEQFEALKKKNPDYWAYFYYEAGVAYINMNQFDKAIPMLEAFLNKYPADANRAIYRHQGNYKLEYARKQTELAAAPAEIAKPVKLPTPINSKWGDYFPMMNPTGTKLYFTSTRIGGIKDENETGDTDKPGDEDIYFIEKNGAQWGSPQLLPEPVNSTGNDGSACFSADGQTMVYGACGLKGGIGSCDLYVATLEGNEWTKPVNLGNVVNSEQWDAQPSLSSDGTRIIFASNRPGGYGSEDLYMTEKNAFGEWGPPANLGGTINTPFSDMTPFLSQDGKTLYFSSNGHPGYGGQDLFKSTFENGKWTAPVNLGRHLNNEGDNRFFTIGGSGEVGYYASAEANGDLDLYEVSIPEAMRPQPTVVVNGIVMSVKGNQPLAAYVLIEDLNSGELVAVSKSNSSTGKYLVVLPAGRTYSVSANKESYFFHSELFDVPMTAKYQEIKKDIILKPIEKGAKIVLNNIFFETGKAILSPQSRVEMDKATDLLKANPTMIIEVGGHTDNVGDDNFNMKLSHDRAKTVRDYLVNAGISSSRIQSKGYGESNPVASNDTEEGRKSNRRTEFLILEF